MRKMFLLLFAIPIMLVAQNQMTDRERAWIEEHGDGQSVITEQIINAENSTWSNIAQAPNAFGRVVYGVIGEYLYVFASQNATGMAAAYHIPSDTWVSSTPATAAGYNAASCVENGEIFKLSGTGSVNVFEKFTPSANGLGTWTVLTSPASTLLNAQVSIIGDGNGYVYAYSSGTTSPYPSYFSRFKISDNTWETRAVPQYARRYAGLARVDNFIYLIGGLLSDGSSANICQKYDLNTNTWSLIAAHPETMNFTKWTTTSDGNYVYTVTHGGGYSGFPLSRNVHYYNPATDSWTFDSEFPVNRGLAIGLYATGYGKMIYGGGNDGTAGTTYQTTMWEGNGGPYVPVELSSFSASVSGQKVELNWITATEVNNDRFEIERSSDLVSFEQISTLKGAGTSTSPLSYSFTDEKPLAGVSYYRLKQVDFDGTFSYSDVVNADVTINSYQLSQNYPNPFGNGSQSNSTSINYTLPERTSVKLGVYSITGELIEYIVDEIQEAGVYSVNYSSTKLPAGVYFYTITAGNFRETAKMTITK